MRATLDPKPYPSHLSSHALLVMAQTEQELSVGATPATIGVHTRLLQLFPEWDPDQRWVIAYELTESAGVPAGIADAVPRIPSVFETDELEEQATQVVTGVVAAAYGVPVAFVRSDSREQRHCAPRQVAMHVLRSITTMSYPAIGRSFGKRDHTSAIHADQIVPVRAVRGDLDVDLDEVKADAREALRASGFPADTSLQLPARKDAP